MIKCFIVKNVGNKSPEGKFKKDHFYIAKISSNNPNTFAVLDDNKNWVSFKYFTRTHNYENHYILYFDIWDEFLIENKKELNEYVSTTKFYK
jgi:O-glycosyl hydrolase